MKIFFHMKSDIPNKNQNVLYIYSYGALFPRYRYEMLQQIWSKITCMRNTPIGGTLCTFPSLLRSYN